MVESLITMYLDAHMPTKEAQMYFPIQQVEKIFQDVSLGNFTEPFETYGTSQYVAQDNFISSYKVANDKLYAYLSLENDWDGYGGVTPRKDIIETGGKLLKKMQDYALDAPNVMISGAGEIGFYWENGTSYAEITCDSPSKYTFVYLEGQNTYYEEDVSIDNRFSFDLIQKISSTYKKS